MDIKIRIEDSLTACPLSGMIAVGFPGAFRAPDKCFLLCNWPLIKAENSWLSRKQFKRRIVYSDWVWGDIAYHEGRRDDSSARQQVTDGAADRDEFCLSSSFNPALDLTNGTAYIWGGPSSSVTSFWRHPDRHRVDSKSSHADNEISLL